MWAEWDGKIANKEQLDVKTRELLRYTREADAQQRALEREQEDLYGVSKEAKDFQGIIFFFFFFSFLNLLKILFLTFSFLEQQKGLQDELRIVSKERYRLDDAAHAVKIFASEAEEQFSRRKGVETGEENS